MKPRVFIGSASESLDVASAVKGELGPDFDVSIWTDDIFRSNKNGSSGISVGHFRPPES